VSPVLIPRDRWGRPSIVPVGGGKPIGYTRVSTLAKALDDTSNLTAWKQRLTAMGVASNPHLAARIAGVMSMYDDPISDGKRDLNSIVEEACEKAGSSTAASTGTALHELTQASDLGRDLVAVPPGLVAHITEYQVGTARLEILDIECFVVCDELQAAGTFDRLVRLPDGRVVVADLKTGAHDANFPLPVATQIAVYAHGQRYDPDTFERTPIHADLNLTVGLLIHLPAKAAPRLSLYELDLEVGWRAAQLATEVRAIRKAKPIGALWPAVPA
jgi:hypothetical protein